MLTTLGQALDQALQAASCSHIRIGSDASVMIYAKDRCYVANLDRLTSAEDLQRVTIVMQPDLATLTPPPDALPIRKLNWHVALQLQRADNGELPISTGLLRLVSWPDLSELPQAIVPPVSRICALLWRKPTAAHLVARILDASPEETALLLRLLLSFGHVQLLAPAFSNERNERPAPEIGVLHHSRPAASSSLLSKLWRRLSFR